MKIFVSGETALKTERAIERARGATMLIDEAYRLVPAGSHRDTGLEALETIMATIEGGISTEDDRPAYIFAGYPAEMERMLAANAGLKRRVTGHFHFTDYSVNELVLIYKKKCELAEIILDIGVNDADITGAISQLEPLLPQHNAGITNSLLAINKEIINNRTVERLLKSSGRMDDDITRSMLSTILADDVKEASRILCERWGVRS